MMGTLSDPMASAWLALLRCIHSLEMLVGDVAAVVTVAVWDVDDQKNVTLVREIRLLQTKPL